MFGNSFRGKRYGSRRTTNPNRQRLRLESLEERRLLAADTLFSFDFEGAGDPFAGLTIQTQGGTSQQRGFGVVSDPASPGSGNDVYEFWASDGWNTGGNTVKTRVQMNIYGDNKLNLNRTPNAPVESFRQVQRMYISPDLNVLSERNQDLEWLTFAEIWNNANWGDTQGTGFRLSMEIEKVEVDANTNEPLIFAVSAGDSVYNAAQDKYQWVGVWGEQSSVAVPIGQWFDLEYYFKEGNANNGRFQMNISTDGGSNWTNVFDITNRTHHPDSGGDGIFGLSPMKLYTADATTDYVRQNANNGDGAIRFYWDNLEIIDRLGADVPAPPTQGGGGSGGSSTTIEVDDATQIALATSNGTTPDVMQNAAAQDGDWVRFKPSSVGDSITVTVSGLAAGNYDVDLVTLLDKWRGQFRVEVNGVDVGSEFDGYASSTTPATLSIANGVNLTAGTNEFKFIYTGQNANSLGKAIALDQLVVESSGSSAMAQSYDFDEASELNIVDSSGDEVLIVSDAEAVGGDYLRYKSNQVGDYITFEFNVAAAGNYALTLSILANSWRPLFQVSIDGVNVGSEQDGYFSGEEYRDLLLDPDYFLSAGTHEITVTYTGQNPLSLGKSLILNELRIEPV